MIDFTRNHYALLGLPETFRCESAALDHAYRTLQAAVHPDRYATSPEPERRLALQASARVNEAYRTLKDAVSRAEYLLQLHDVDAASATDTQLPLPFLERQLACRERADDAIRTADVGALESLLRETGAEVTQLEHQLAVLLDAEAAWTTARGPVRQLRFITQFKADIADALAALED
jgi:molecular chaperone HscB